VCNIEEEPFPSKIGKFNTVVAGEIIEHIFDPDALLKKINSVLVPGGHLILTTPNLAGLGSRMSLLLGRLPWMVENDLLPGRSGHIRYFTYLEIVKLLNRHGFKVTNFTTDSVGINNITIPLLGKLFPTFGRILIVKAIRL
jgi:2-polyprenyl-3-methyl-5-hydroxy-6-metoxy-1,4-benzoquinol methylase